MAYRTAVTFLAALTLPILSSVVEAADKPVELKEQFPANYQYRVNTRVELTGTLTVPPDMGKGAPKTLPVTGNSAIEYDERVVGAADGQVQKTLRIYRRMEFKRKVGDQPQETELRPNVRRLVVLRLKNQEVPFSPDGPLTWGEIEMIRVDVFTPALVGLLPGKPVQVGDRWTAAKSAIEELTDMESIQDGRIECKLEELTTLANRRHARVSLTGKVRGVNEDGPTAQELDGYFYFDLESNHLSYLTFKGIHGLLDKEGKESGRIEGRFVLTRQAHQPAPDLGDAALRGVGLEPTAENTLLLYDNPDLGVRLLYPRRWRVAGVRGRQMSLDEAGGNGLLLTLESPKSLPTPAQYEKEGRDFFQKGKAKVLRAEQAQRIQAAPREVDRFALEVEMAGQKVMMDYFVLRQAQGGATIAARLMPNDLAGLRKDVERIARSVTITAAPK